MQEEVENRAVNLAISTSKLSARAIVSAVRIYLNHRKNVAVKKEHNEEKQPHGKQTVKELIGQGQGVSNIDIAKTDLRGFEKVARKYGVDYAIRKDSSVDPPKYLVFFKAKDSMIFRWDTCLNDYRKEASAKDCQKRIKELALEGIRFFQQLKTRRNIGKITPEQMSGVEEAIQKSLGMYIPESVEAP